MASTINSLSTGSGGITSAGDASGVLALQTNSTTAVTIDTSQNVGIGTASPASKLDVKAGSGSVISRSTSGYNFKAYYDDGRTTYTAIGYDGLYTVGAQDLILTAGQGASQSMQFRTSDTERMRIDSSGNLLVNSTTNVAGQIWIGVKAGVLNAIEMAPTTAASYGAMTFRKNDNSGIGSISCTTSATSFTTTSDYRLKENIAPMTGALTKVALLKPVTYTWKDGGEDAEGFIAHELAEVCPHAVTGEKDAVDADGNPVYQGIDTSFLVATLTAAIQELKSIVDAQAVEIAALKAKVGS